MSEHGFFDWPTGFEPSQSCPFACPVPLKTVYCAQVTPSGETGSALSTQKSADEPLVSMWGEGLDDGETGKERHPDAVLGTLMRPTNLTYIEGTLRRRWETGTKLQRAWRVTRGR